LRTRTAEFFVGILIIDKDFSMHSAPTYRRYPEIIKEEVARTGNIYLFPDLKIPRTTAQYWAKKQKHQRAPNMVQVESVYKRKSEFLAEELAKEKAMRELLETVRKAKNLEPACSACPL
jgi:hypothetical protein